MSLKELAKQVRAEGRGKDDQLVHLTSREVKGLHQLAKAAGGKLTTNPKTGLPEAGFLDSILPTILGFAASFIPGMQPLGAAAISAGSKALLDEDASLTDIALAGLGGYGGANLGAGLSSMGSSAAQAAMTPAAEAAGQAAIDQAAQQAGAAIGQGLQVGGVEGLQLAGGTGLQAAPSSFSAQLAASQPMSYQSALSPMELQGVRNQAMADVYRSAGDQFAAQPFSDRITQSLQAPFAENSGGLSALTTNLGGTMPALKTAGMAAAPAIYDSMKPQPMGTGEDAGPGEVPKYRYAAEQTGDYYGTGGGYGTYERNYFTSPTYQRLAEGGPTKPAGATAGAMDYLMGKSAQSPAAVQAQQFTARRAAAAPVQPIIDRSAMPADFMPAAQPRRRAFSGLNFKMRGDSPQRATGSPRYTERKVADGYSFDPASQQFVPKYRMEYDPIVTDEQGQSHSGLDRQWASPMMRRGQGLALSRTGLFGRNRQASGNPQYRFDPNTQQFSRMAEGGLASLAKGGSMEHMGSGDFIISSDVTAYAGGGSTRAGQEKLSKKLGARPINGAGDGLSDDIPATIDGKPVAKVADGEMRVPREQVAKLGNGNPKKGAKKLYAMMDNIRKQAVGHKKQVRPVNIDKALA